MVAQWSVPTSQRGQSFSVRSNLCKPLIVPLSLSWQFQIWVIEVRLIYLYVNQKWARPGAATGKLNFYNLWYRLLWRRILLSQVGQSSIFHNHSASRIWKAVSIELKTLHRKRHSWDVANMTAYTCKSFSDWRAEKYPNVVFWQKEAMSSRQFSISKQVTWHQKMYRLLNW